MPATAAAVVEPPTSPGAVVLRYEEAQAELAAHDVPWLEVRGDGHVLVHRPAYMKGAGDTETWLTPQEMASLLHEVAGRGVLDVDPEAVRRNVRALQAQARRNGPAGGVELVHSSEGRTTTLVIRLQRYVPDEGRGPEQRDVVRAFRWHDLDFDAERFPQVAGLPELAAAHASVRALMQRSDLKVKP